jgi:hypothetical protein
MFGTKGTTVTEGNGESPRAYFKPGIHIARIVDVEFVTTTNGKDKAVITFEGKPHGGDFQHPKGSQYKGSLATTDLWLTDNAMEITNQTLATIGDKLGFRDQLDAVGGSTAEEYTNNLKKVLVGKVGRWKFAGEEVKNDKIGDDGEPLSNWFKTKLARYRFVEPTSVSDADSKLKFDENNKYDMQRLEVADDDIANAATEAMYSGESTDDEPW